MSNSRAKGLNKYTPMQGPENVKKVNGMVVGSDESMRRTNTRIRFI